ncbi:MAG: hypothetical protein ACO1Q7_06665 [Gemmatimonas sp.]
MLRRILPWCAAAVLVGCAESPSAAKPAAATSTVAAGYYRAESFDGLPLPVKSSQVAAETGDLVLLDDGTIRAQMVGGSFELGQPMLEGTWKLDASALTITSLDKAHKRTGTLAGDSLVLSMPMQQMTATGDIIREAPVVFRRMMPDGVPIRSGTYVLQDSPAHADTITFYDGVFYKRKESTSVKSREFWGAYRGSGSEMVLLSSISELGDEAAVSADTLSASKDGLQRRKSSAHYKPQQ